MIRLLVGLLTLGLITAVPTVVEAGDVRVRGYYRKDGTYVAPHYRSAPDRSYNNNWSTRPNINPYTGKRGTRAPTWNDRPPQSPQPSFPSYEGYGGYYQPQTYSPPLQPLQQEQERLDEELRGQQARLQELRETPSHPIEIESSTPRIIDADTLEVAGQRVRLRGIDAPESTQSCQRARGKRYLCGDRATQALRERIGTSTVTCTIEDQDRFNRALGTCYADGTDLAGWLVRQGHALAYRKSSARYVSQEDQAKAAKTGVWGATFVKPWDWRRGERLPVPR